MQFNIMPVWESSHVFCSKSLNSLGSSIRTVELVWITPFQYCAPPFSMMLPTAENNFGDWRSKTLFFPQSLPGLCHLPSPFRHEGHIDQKFWNEADSISNSLIFREHVRSCVPFFVSRYISSLFYSSCLRNLTQFPKVFFPLKPSLQRISKGKV